MPVSIPFYSIQCAHSYCCSRFERACPTVFVPSRMECGGPALPLLAVRVLHVRAQRSFLVIVIIFFVVSSHSGIHAFAFIEIGLLFTSSHFTFVEPSYVRRFVVGRKFPLCRACNVVEEFHSVPGRRAVLWREVLVAR